MELWIRSQDKKALREVHDLNIDRSNGQYNICIYTGISNIILGKYGTERRALEVLDEIQNFLETRENVEQMVYEMPKE